MASAPRGWSARFGSVSRTPAYPVVQPAIQPAAPRKRVAVTALRKRQVAQVKKVEPPRSSLLAVVDQPDIQPVHQRIADEVLRLMPARCRDQLKSFYVRYDQPKHRGLAGKETMVLAGHLPNDEFRALFVHEFGHVMDLGCFQGTRKSGESTFRDGAQPIYLDDPSLGFYQISWVGSAVQAQHSKADDFVTGYAAWDVFEDFSESVAYYVFQRDAFEARALENPIIAAKLAWLKANIFTDNLSVATGQHVWSGTVPWDATKLAYEWHPQVNVAVR